MRCPTIHKRHAGPSKTDQIRSFLWENFGFGPKISKSFELTSLIEYRLLLFHLCRSSMKMEVEGDDSLLTHKFT